MSAGAEALPLRGRRVVLTRTERDAEEMARELAGLGAEPLIFPAVEVIAPRDPGPMERAARALADHDWVVFTSRNAVERFARAVVEAHGDCQTFAGRSIAAIGPATAAALLPFGLRADLVPQDHVGEGLAEELIAELGANPRRILLPRARSAREVLPEALRARGHEVCVVPVYETRAPSGDRVAELAGRLERGEVDAIVFASSSAVEHVVAALGLRGRELLASTRSVSIGPATSHTLYRHGLTVAGEAVPHTGSGLLAAVLALFESAPLPTTNPL